jgi:hypothetical protein
MRPFFDKNGGSAPILPRRGNRGTDDCIFMLSRLVLLKNCNRVIIYITTFSDERQGFECGQKAIENGYFLWITFKI